MEFERRGQIRFELEDVDRVPVLHEVYSSDEHLIFGQTFTLMIYYECNRDLVVSLERPESEQITGPPITYAIFTITAGRKRMTRAMDADTRSGAYARFPGMNSRFCDSILFQQTIVFNVEFAFSAFVQTATFDVADELSDHVLIIGKGQKDQRRFGVNRDFLAIHSTFFAELFAEDTVNETVLEDISGDEFDEFLRVIYPESKAVTSRNVRSLLRLADMFQAPKVMSKCVEFLMCSSHELALDERLALADHPGLLGPRMQALQEFANMPHSTCFMRKELHDSLSEGMRKEMYTVRPYFYVSYDSHALLQLFFTPTQCRCPFCTNRRI